MRRQWIPRLAAVGAFAAVSSVALSYDAPQCSQWARANAKATSPAGGGTLGGAARGAAGGALIGAIAGNAGTGAAIGAATGALVGGGEAASQREYDYETLFRACVDDNRQLMSSASATMPQESAVPEASRSQAPARSLSMCQAWARGQAEQNAPRGGGALGGAARGALGGALIGAIFGNAGRGAAIGAATGGISGGARASSEREKTYDQYLDYCLGGGVL